MDDTTDAARTEPKRPYRTPELRDLGSIAEVTQTAQGTAGTDGGTTAGYTS
jgi:hypothetical protein